MTVADPSAAIAGFLQAQVGALVGNRVFRPTLPESENPHMPRACIVIRRAGGYTMTGGDTIQIGDPRMSVICYAATMMGAENIAQAALVALKGLQRVKVQSTLVHWVRISAGPIPMVDPQTQWPTSVLAIQVLHAEQAVS